MSLRMFSGLSPKWIAPALLSLVPSLAIAADAVPAKIDSGDTAWMLISTALVLLMTPGLAFFYGGLVHTRNVVSTMFQSFVALSVVGLLWAVVGYSLVFSGDSGGLIGNLNWFMLRGVGQEPNPDYAATIPHQVFMLFQCMFAVITPALITGAFAGRVKFRGWLLMLTLWSLLVYFPAAHSVWGVGGWIRNLGALDFAGGLVVHMTAGYSALVAAVLFKKRKDFEQAGKPYDTGMVLLGAALLWFGWFGFNAGSAIGSNGLAGQAFATTFFAAAAAGLSWMVMDTVIKGKPSAVGLAIGIVAGLVAVTPAAGFVSTGSAILIGLITGVVCNWSIVFLKEKLKLDDTLDVFGCHGVGGTLGTILTGVFADKTINSAGADGLIVSGSMDLLKAQIIAAGAVIIFSMVITFVIIKLIDAIVGIQVNQQEESMGLDQTQHGEIINQNFEVALSSGSPTSGVGKNS